MKGSELPGSGSPSALLAALKADGLGVDGRAAGGSAVLSGLLVPRSPEGAKVDLPEAERQAEEQLHTCHALAEAAGSAAEVLTGAGVGLQREAAAVTVDGPGAGPFLEADRSATPAASRSLAAACSGLGASLVGLAAVLTGEVLAPLQELRQILQSQIDQQKSKLDQLVKDERLCSNALTESIQRKEKASAELQERVREREVQGKGKRSLLGRLKATHGKAEHKLQHAAQAQTAAVEELAMRADQVAMARFSKDQGAEVLGSVLAQARASCEALLEAALRRCACAWDEVVESLRGTAEQLRGDASGLGEVGATQNRPLSVPARAGQEARRLVPRLQLGVACAAQVSSPDAPFPHNAASASCAEVRAQAWGAQASQSTTCSSSAGSDGKEFATSGSSRLMSNVGIHSSGTLAGAHQVDGSPGLASRTDCGLRGPAMHLGSSPVAWGSHAAGEALPSARSTTSVGDSFVSGVVSPAGGASSLAESASPIGTPPAVNGKVHAKVKEQNDPSFATPPRALASSFSAEASTGESCLAPCLAKAGDSGAGTHSSGREREGCNGVGAGLGRSKSYEEVHAPRDCSRTGHCGTPPPQPAGGIRYSAAGSASSQDSFVSEVVSPGEDMSP